MSEPVPAVTATEVMMLVNMTTREELLDDEEFADIELDIQEECENFGKVMKPSCAGAIITMTPLDRFSRW